MNAFINTFKTYETSQHECDKFINIVKDIGVALFRDYIDTVENIPENHVNNTTLNNLMLSSDLCDIIDIGRIYTLWNVSNMVCHDYSVENNTFEATIYGNADGENFITTETVHCKLFNSLKTKNDINKVISDLKIMLNDMIEKSKEIDQNEN